MTSKVQIPAPISEGARGEPQKLIRHFILEQFSKLANQEALGLNSRVKRTFVRP